MKIMIVEDDRTIATRLKDELEGWDHQVVIASDLDNVLQEYIDQDPQLVLLDVMLPGKNGYYWCQAIRRVSSVPIIFLTSKNENSDIIMGVQYGADDYLCKPFDMNVVIAKINAVLRRSYEWAGDRLILKFADVILDLSRSCVFREEGANEQAIGKATESSVTLSRTELTIANELFRAAGQVVSRETLMESCWQGDDFIDDNTLAVNMTRLRKKLASIGHPDLIHTIKGVGYQLWDGGRTNG